MRFWNQKLILRSEIYFTNKEIIMKISDGINPGEKTSETKNLFKFSIIFLFIGYIFITSLNYSQSKHPYASINLSPLLKSLKYQAPEVHGISLLNRMEILSISLPVTAA